MEGEVRSKETNGCAMIVFARPMTKQTDVSLQRLCYLGSFVAFHSSSVHLDGNEGAAGAGIGNVKNRMMPTSRKAYEDLFAHTKSPKTVSIIG